MQLTPPKKKKKKIRKKLVMKARGGIDGRRAACKKTKAPLIQGEVRINV